MKPLALSRISFNSDTMTFKSALPPDPSDLNLAPLLKRERLNVKYVRARSTSQNSQNRYVDKSENITEKILDI